MFRNKAEKEDERQREALLKSTQARLQKRQKEWFAQIEAYKQSVAEKWEYMEVTSQQLANAKMNLNDLGQQGWELVGITSYSEGMGTLYWHQVYVFKRQIPELPEVLLAQGADIPKIEWELVELETQLEKR